ncbi:MAG TPA: hypothetical protein PK961_05485 [bacterium]|nr:hypothetical protein [bacterium]
MLKLIGRYLIAAIMIPVGVAVGVAGWIQNKLRQEYYRRRFQEIRNQIQQEEIQNKQS